MTLPYGSHHERMMQAFINAGYPPQIAAGFVGNAMMESGTNINPAIVNRGEGAIGAFQHRLSRRSQLEALAVKNGSTVTDLDTQIAFALQELGSTYANADAKIRQAQTPEEAAALVDRYYEQSAQKHTPQRQEYARHVYNQFTGGASPGPSLTTLPNGQPVGGLAARGGGSLLDQLSPPDMMMHAAAGDAPAGAADLMSGSSDEPFVTFDPSMGLAALGEAISAWGGNRPMNTQHLAVLREQRADQKEKVNEREGMIHLLNQEGHTDLAESIVNGASVDDVQIAYEARIANSKTTDDIRNLREIQRLKAEGKTAEAELLARSSGMLDSPLSEARKLELWNSASPEDREALISTGIFTPPKPENVPDIIEVAERLANPDTPEEVKKAIREQMNPAQMAIIERIGTDPEFADWYKTQQELQAATTKVDINNADPSVALPKELAEIDAARIGKLADNADLAAQRENDLTTMSHLLDTGMETGAIAGLLAPVRNLINDLGYTFEDLPGQQAFQSIQQGLLPTLMSDIKGAASDFESKALLNAIPALDKDEMANRILIQSLHKKNELEMQKAEFYRDYASDPANGGSLRGADTAWREYKSDSGMQIFKQYKTQAEAFNAIESGQVQPNEVVIIGTPDQLKNTKLYLGRHLITARNRVLGVQ